MLTKTLKIKGAAKRTELVEFLVSKRVKFLEYLKDLHSENGVLWMNSVHLDKVTCGRHFGVREECLKQHVSDNTELNNNKEEPDSNNNNNSNNSDNSSRKVQRAIPKHDNSNVSDEQSKNNIMNISIPIEPSSNSNNKKTTETFPSAININLAQLPQRKNADESIHKWQTHQLSLLTSLAFALSDLIASSPMSSALFIECVYLLWMEVEVAFANNPASKMLALRKLNQCKLNCSTELKESLFPSYYKEREVDINNNNNSSSNNNDNNNDNNDNNNNNIESNNSKNSYNTINEENLPRYLFLKPFQPHLCYTHTRCSHDMLFPSLCELLVFVYRRMCDYEVMNYSTVVKKILFCDRKIMRWVVCPLVHQVNEIAQRQLLTEMYVLSPSGLFNELNNVNRFIPTTRTTTSATVPRKNNISISNNADNTDTNANKRSKVTIHDKVLSTSNISDVCFTSTNQSAQYTVDNTFINELLQAQLNAQGQNSNDESNLEDDIDDDDIDDDEDAMNNNRSNNDVNVTERASSASATTRVTTMQMRMSEELDDADDMFAVEIKLSTDLEQINKQLTIQC